MANIGCRIVTQNMILKWFCYQNVI